MIEKNYSIVNNERAWDAFVAGASVYGALHPKHLGNYPGWGQIFSRVQDALYSAVASATEAPFHHAREGVLRDQYQLATIKTDVRMGGIRLRFGTGATSIILHLEPDHVAEPAHLAVVGEVRAGDEESRVYESVEWRAAACRAHLGTEGEDFVAR